MRDGVACPFGDLALGPAAGRQRNAVEDDEPEGRIERHQAADIDFRRAVAVARVDGDRAVALKASRARGQIAAEVDFDNAVDTRPARQLPHTLDNVLHAVVDHRVRAAGQRVPGLGLAADGRKDARAAPLRELHRIMADRTRAPGHQNGQSLHRTVRKKATVRRHRRNAEGRPLGEGAAVGQLVDQVRVQGDVFRRRTEGAPQTLAVVEPDAQPDPGRVDPRPDPVDRAGPVAVRDHPREIIAVIVGSGPELHVRRVHAGGGQRNPHLPRARFRRIRRAEHQHVARGALPLVPCGPHKLPPLARSRMF